MPYQTMASRGIYREYWLEKPSLLRESQFYLRLLDEDGEILFRKLLLFQSNHRRLAVVDPSAEGRAVELTEFE